MLTFADGTNHIGGTGDSQSSAAWLVPITIQILPAIILGIFINMMPSSPRWLMNQGREEDCLNVIAGLRRQPTDAPLVQLEYLEIKAQRLFELRVSAHDHPHLQDGSTKSNFKLGLAGYKSLFSSRPNLKRTSVAVLIMLFQQWTGVVSRSDLSGRPLTSPDLILVAGQNFILYVSSLAQT